jgi:hypothetical protein
VHNFIRIHDPDEIDEFDLDIRDQDPGHVYGELAEGPVWCSINAWPPNPSPLGPTSSRSNPRRAPFCPNRFWQVLIVLPPPTLCLHHRLCQFRQLRPAPCSSDTFRHFCFHFR